MFRVVACNFLILILPSTQPKMRLGRGRESDDSGVPQSLQYNFLPPWRIKMRLNEFGKKIIQGAANPWKSILCLLPTENATWARSRKRYFKERTGRKKLFSPSVKFKLQI
jgi:hypothetical protein